MCHSSFRGVVELLRDLFDTSMSVGTVHNVVRGAVGAAREVNARADLSHVRVGAHDEIFQGGAPVLVGADVHSTYCYLLSHEEHRDADTWGVRLLEVAAQGLKPQATVADGGLGLRAGQALAWPDVPCRGDVFHAERDAGKAAIYLENRALGTISYRETLEQKMVRAKRRGRGNEVSKKLALARQEEARAVTLADDVEALARWLQHDVLALAGPDHPTRRVLFDFIVEELKAREPLCPHRIGPVRRSLEHQRDDLLAFAVELDEQIARLAERFQLAPAIVRAVLALECMDPKAEAHGRHLASLRQKLGARFHALQADVAALARDTVRASSVIENINSRLRCYFFLRRHLGSEYLDLLRFFLNHRTFLRSEHPDRVGKSPAEILAGEPHPHWLELLGFERFHRN